MSGAHDPKERKAGELNQHGCSMTGFAFQVMDLAGPELAVVIFGERDCVSAFPRTTSRWAVNPWWDVYTVALGETDVVAGRAEQKLEECLNHVSEVLAGRGPITGDMLDGIPAFAARQAFIQSGVQPRILVLSTCLSEVTGAAIEPVCRRVESRTGIRIIPVATSGLKLKTQAEVVDEVAETMISGFGDFGDVDAAAVNLLGFQTDRANDADADTGMFRTEAATIIDAFGGRLNSAVPAGATVADWRMLPRGALNFVSDTSVLSKVVAMLSGGGRRFIEVVQPKGVAASDQFYSAIAAALGVDPAPFLDRYAPRLDALAVVKDARARFAGMRLAYGIGTLHNFRPDVLAREGLGNLPMFLELGFDVEIVIQERDYPEVHDRIRRNLKALGVDAPYRLYYEPAVLEPALREGKFGCAYVADFMRDQVARAGIPMLNFGEMNSGYRFAGEYVRQIMRTLGSDFDSRFGKYLGGQGEKR